MVQDILSRKDKAKKNVGAIDNLLP
jgi:hypothetical protein